MMKYRTLIAVLLLVTDAVAAQDTVRMTLDSCLRYAYSHNLQVRAATLNRESADVTLTGAKMRFLPSISASASEGWSWSDQTTRSGSVASAEASPSSTASRTCSTTATAVSAPNRATSKCNRPRTASACR